MTTPTLEKILSQDAIETCENMTKTIARVLLEHDVPVEEQMLVMASIMATMQAVIDDCYNEGVKAGDAGVLKEAEEKKKVKLPRKIDDIETGVFKDKEKVLVRGVNIQLDGKNIWN